MDSFLIKKLASASVCLKIALATRFGTLRLAAVTVRRWKNVRTINFGTRRRANVNVVSLARTAQRLRFGTTRLALASARRRENVKSRCGSGTRGVATASAHRRKGSAARVNFGIPG